MDNIEEKIKTIAEKGGEVKNEVKEKTLGYILTALGLVAGLAWNDTIKAFIEYIFPMDKNTILAQFIYAILITVLVVILSIYLSKLFSKNSGE